MVYNTPEFNPQHYSQVMTSLPNGLAAEFPGTLTHRSGPASSVFALQWSFFVNGIGAKQFSNLLCTLHLCKFDLMQIQCLEIIDIMCLTCPWSNTIYEPFSSYDDPEGYAGFVPCSQWLQDLFDCFVEKHNIDIEQFTAMLSARVCAIDHSHKITKHIIMINGVPVFIGLWTVTNQYGEIRVMALVATKAHAQFETALTEM